jgi:hypothetical protein
MASFNPFKALEELINEHGSAVIQGKHIALLKDQIAILKEQFLLMEGHLGEALSRVTELETENKNLKLKTEKIPNVAIGAAPILGALHASGPELTVEQLCEMTKLDMDDVEHIWAGNLEMNGFVELLKYPDGRLLSMAILPAGRTAWVRHRNVMKKIEG